VKGRECLRGEGPGEGGVPSTEVQEALAPAAVAVAVGRWPRPAAVVRPQEGAEGRGGLPRGRVSCRQALR